MKKLIFLIVLVLATQFVLSQTDTLFSGKKAILCKIVEISESEFKYKKAELLDGPTYVIDKVKVTKYTLASGYSEVVVPDELSVEHEHREILGNREVIKVQPFSLALNYISIGYEKVLKVGTNIDFEIGYINNSMTTNKSYYNYGINSESGYPFCYGFYFKPGVKFFLGQDFSVKGLKYAHPLKGRYIKLDLAISYLNFKDITRYWNTYSSPIKVKTDLATTAFGGFISYGRQFILGNVLTLDYYLGIGFTAQTYSYSNPDFNTPPANAYGYYYSWRPVNTEEARNIYRYGGFVRIPGVGISGTAGLRLGYIIPSKKPVNRGNAAIPVK